MDQIDEQRLRGILKKAPDNGAFLFNWCWDSSNLQHGENYQLKRKKEADR